MVRFVVGVSTGAVLLALAGATAGNEPWWITLLLAGSAVAIFAGFLTDAVKTSVLAGTVAGIAVMLGGRPMEGFGTVLLALAYFARRVRLEQESTEAT